MLLFVHLRVIIMDIFPKSNNFPESIYNYKKSDCIAITFSILFYRTSNLYPTPQTVFRFHLSDTPSSFSRRRFTWTSTVRESPK